MTGTAPSATLPGHVETEQEAKAWAALLATPEAGRAEPSYWNAVEAASATRWVTISPKGLLQEWAATMALADRIEAADDQRAAARVRREARECMEMHLAEVKAAAEAAARCAQRPSPPPKESER